MPTQSFAHKAKVLEDYKIELGWENEPPVVGEENAIELIIKLASDYEKENSDQIFGNIVGDPNIPTSNADIKDLSDKLEVIVKLGDTKNTLKLVEDPDFAGVYYGKYTPKETGHANVDVYGIIKNLEFEATFKPEKIEEGTTQMVQPTPQSTIPDWIRNNAGWWADGQIDDDSFVQGIQYLIKQGIMKIPPTNSEEGNSSQIIPDWIKNNAKWWADGQISDNDFIKGVQFLIQNGIISV
ncbi:MAG: peptidase [Nitrosopumilus sp.]